jgi:bacteriocin biosynthesis cyclodehydratase domain-containing protein
MQDTSTTSQGKELPDRPYLKPWYRLAQSDDRLVLEYGHATVVLEGKAVAMLLPLLLPMLDGRRTIDEINQHVGEDAAPAVANALTVLTERGVLTDGPPLPEDTPTPVTETAHFLSALSGDGRTVTESEEVLSQATLAVVGTGPTAREIAMLLSVAGVTQLTVVDWKQTAESASADLVVVAPEPEELGELESWNRRAVESGTPWLQALPFDGHMAVVGPLYVPGETCCYECYRRRRAANVSYPTDDYWALEDSPASYPSPPPMRHMVAGLAAMFALQWLSDRAAGRASQPVATMHALEWAPSVEVSRHRVYRVPRCQVCFPDDLGVPTPWDD